MDSRQGTDVVASAYELHRSSLLRYLTGLTRDPGVAEDLVQETFVRLMIEVRANRIPEDLGGWVHRVGHNLAMSHGRHLSVVDRHRAELTRSGLSISPEQVTVDAERDREVHAVLGDLDPVQRRALLLAAMGYGGAEIALAIGRTNGATRTMLCRARAKVRSRVASGVSAIAS
jgi:RNA polymerase sigma-70 factor (ECF subfamily)